MTEETPPPRINMVHSLTSNRSKETTTTTISATLDRLDSDKQTPSYAERVQFLLNTWNTSIKTMITKHETKYQEKLMMGESVPVEVSPSKTTGNNPSGILP